MLTNQTPLPATVQPHRDQHGKAHLLVIAKGSWRLSNGRLAPAEQQVGIHRQPLRLRLGDLELEPAQTMALRTRLDEDIVWVNHDVSPPKPAFDVLVAGYVTAPPGHPHLFIDAGLRIGARSASMRAFAPRIWEKTWLGYKARALAPAVRRVPISYALADWDAGFALGAPGRQEDAEPARLPWIEAPDSQCQHDRHARVPAGLGYWPEAAAHRQCHVGTFGKARGSAHSADLPGDFNTRFYNEAHPSLQLPDVPAAGTPIRLVHLASRAIIDCQFPALALAVQGRTAGGDTRPLMALRPDTLIIEPDHDRLSVVWRALLPDGVQGGALRSLHLFKTGSPMP
ncbi:DUF2169 domain-containing protein [Massilia genomosp. 1]|uniref:DUF2169 domain-containing protein n=1 Tax=Massilia genomosp. 1 TaxID=2609280 RepID=A0ABX0MVK7_9BURK|nr:DUF2169 domain-containing protein [Massilia genomosp. 1]NHZ64326.1 DUF2169 domain-containing protein [Massilia genomosp. 1]